MVLASPKGRERLEIAAPFHSRGVTAQTRDSVCVLLRGGRNYTDEAGAWSYSFR